MSETRQTTASFSDGVRSGYMGWSGPSLLHANSSSYEFGIAMGSLIREEQYRRNAFWEHLSPIWPHVPVDDRKERAKYGTRLKQVGSDLLSEYREKKHEHETSMQQLLRQNPVLYIQNSDKKQEI